MESTALDVSMTSDAVAATDEPVIRFWHIFTSPVSTMTALRARPTVVLPMLIAAFFATLVSYYAIERIGLRNLMEASIRTTATVDPDTVIETAMRHKTTIMQMQAAGAFFGTIVTVFALALLYWLLATVAGADLTYHRTAAVVAHVVFFTTMIKQSMIGVAVSLARNPATFNMKQPLGTNPAFFIKTDSLMLARLMSSLDLIVVAGLVLTVLGLKRVSERLSTFAATVIVLVPWAGYVGARMLFPALA